MLELPRADRIAAIVEKGSEAERLYEAAFLMIDTIIAAIELSVDSPVQELNERCQSFRPQVLRDFNEDHRRFYDLWSIDLALKATLVPHPVQPSLFGCFCESHLDAARRLGDGVGAFDLLYRSRSKTEHLDRFFQSLSPLRASTKEFSNLKFLLRSELSELLAGGGKKLGKSSGSKTAASHIANCDAWLIDRWEKGDTYKKILADLNKKPKAWIGDIATIQGLRSRLDLAYKRAGLSRPKREKGRRS